MTWMRSGLAEWLLFTNHGSPDHSFQRMLSTG
jgi:hypothetical protein